MTYSAAIKLKIDKQMTSHLKSMDVSSKINTQN